MKIVKFGIGAATCLAFGACAGFLPEPALEGCYAVDTLSMSQRAALHVGRGNPILLAGGREIVCACYQDSSLAGNNEKDRLTGQSEKSYVIGKGEDVHVIGKGEEAHITGEGEKARLAGRGEEGHVIGKDEKDHIVGKGEKDRLAGDFAKLSCGIVPKCPGFQLTGYAPKHIIMLTATGQKSVPTSCITW